MREEDSKHNLTFKDNTSSCCIPEEVVTSASSVATVTSSSQTRLNALAKNAALAAKVVLLSLSALVYRLLMRVGSAALGSGVSATLEDNRSVTAALLVQDSSETWSPLAGWLNEGALEEPWSLPARLEESQETVDNYEYPRELVVIDEDGGVLEPNITVL